MDFFPSQKHYFLSPLCAFTVVCHVLFIRHHWARQCLSPPLFRCAYWFVSFCFWNLCDDLKFRCECVAWQYPKTVWKMEKDHRYFQFAKWMKENRAQKIRKLFRFAKIAHTHRQFRKMLAEKKRVNQRTLSAVCWEPRGPKGVCTIFMHDDFFFSFQFYLCGHFFTFVYASFLFLSQFSCVCSKTIHFLCRHATIHRFKAWVTNIGWGYFFHTRMENEEIAHIV